MVHSSASGGGKIGRLMFPLLLILLPLFADAALVRCASANCGSSQAPAQPSTFDETLPDQRLEFPFPLGTGTFSGSGSSGLSLGLEEGEVDEAEAGTEESNDQTSNTGGRKAPVAAAQTEPQTESQAPTAQSAPAIPQVGPTTTGERATRNYRTYETPAPRRIYDHPSAGGAGRTSAFPAPAAGSQSSIPSSTSSSSSTAPPAPPPPPPPGQGSPGGFAPGEPGELAGFIG
jgi:hypothetical protein